MLKMTWKTWKQIFVKCGAECDRMLQLFPACLQAAPHSNQLEELKLQPCYLHQNSQEVVSVM